MCRRFRKSLMILLLTSVGADNQAYLDWVDTISANYEHSVYVPSSRRQSKGVAVHWSIVDDEWLEIAVAAPASGWVGFGISELGGMHGSDMAIYAKKRPTEILDTHVLEELYPQVDDCQQDWIYVNHHSTSEDSEATARQASTHFLMFEARRKLDTGDPQDMQIVRDGDPIVPATHVIAAWGDEEDYANHGPNAARGAVRFHGALDESEGVTFAKSMNAAAEGSFVVGAKDYTIPSDRTTYEEFCFTRADLIAQGVPDTNDSMSLIGFEAVVSEGSSATLVKHLTVYGLSSSSDTACREGRGNPFVYGWAPGGFSGYAFPDNLGISIFGDGDFQAFELQIHYDNPAGQVGLVDNSGIKVYFTSQTREIEAGFLRLANPFLNLKEPISDGLSQHTFECSPSCSSFFVEEGESVTVIRENMHMHQMGTRMTNEVIRNEETIHTASIEVWDFANGNSPVQQEPYVVKPGDSFRTTCYYETSKAVDSTPPQFGMGSNNEMCIAFMLYYPRKVWEGEGRNVAWTCGYANKNALSGSMCGSSYDVAETTESGLNRAFGALTCEEGGEPPNSAPAPQESTSNKASMQVASVTIFVAIANLAFI